MNAVPTCTGLSTRLHRLLRPRSMAVIGGHAAAEVVRQCRKMGFAGEVWPVHPRLDEVAGHRAFRCVADLPGVPDAAFIGVNRRASLTLTRELAGIGCGGAVAFASGYAEAGDEGRALQAELLAEAGAMPFLGPNCYGFLNYFDRALVWPDQFGGGTVDRGVAIITQSGNIGLNVTMQRRALPIGYVITLGNQAAVSHAAVMQAVLDDPRVSAIGLHMEGLDDPHALADAVARAHDRGVSVVALKTGRSEAGARIAQSHTAALASGDAVVDAFFRRIGVARVNSIPALLETLKLLHLQGPLPGRSIASLSCSGGEAALMADSAVSAGLDFAPLSVAAQEDIGATLPELASISNPLDYHTFGWRDRAALAATFAAMMRAGADLNILILDFPRPDTCETADWDIAADAMADAAAATGARAAVLATLPEALPEGHAMALAVRGIVPLFGMEEALHAIRAAADAGFESAAVPFLPACVERTAQALSEWDGKRLLATYGVAVPQGSLASSIAQAHEAADAIGFPVVVKTVGASLAHKTDLGGVRLNLYNSEEVAAASGALLPLTGQILVERMVSDVMAELIVGVARDAVLGLYLVIGSGGIFAELVTDTATLLLPASRAEVAQALGTLRVSRLIAGFRGAAAGDMLAAVAAILAIQDFAMAHAGRLHELDVNPLMVRREGLGAVAADVFMRLAPEANHV